MIVETSADRLLFLDAGDFGVAANYLQGGNAAVAITGIFDAAHQLIGLGAAEVSSLSPIFTCRSEDLDALLETEAQDGDLLQIGSVIYTVRGIQPDGTGMTVLILEKQQ